MATTYTISGLQLPCQKIACGEGIGLAIAIHILPVPTCGDVATICPSLLGHLTFKSSQHCHWFDCIESVGLESWADPGGYMGSGSTHLFG